MKGTKILYYTKYIQYNYISEPANNQNQVFVIMANKNHWVILSNIQFPLACYVASYDEEERERINCFMSDALNDPSHAQSAESALAKLFPEQNGHKIQMVRVEQQTASNDCGLFVCAYAELLSHGHDPSQCTYIQVQLRTIQTSSNIWQNLWVSFLSNTYNNAIYYSASCYLGL